MVTFLGVFTCRVSFKNKETSALTIMTNSSGLNDMNKSGLLEPETLQKLAGAGPGNRRHFTPPFQIQAPEPYVFGFGVFAEEPPGSADEKKTWWQKQCWHELDCYPS